MNLNSFTDDVFNVDSKSAAPRKVEIYDISADGLMEMYSVRDMDLLKCANTISLFGKSDINGDVYDLNMQQTMEQYFKVWSASIQEKDPESEFVATPIFDDNSRLSSIKMNYFKGDVERETTEKLPDEVIDALENKLMSVREGKPGLNLETGEIEGNINQKSIKTFSESGKQVLNSKLQDIDFALDDAGINIPGTDTIFNSVKQTGEKILDYGEEKMDTFKEEHPAETYIMNDLYQKTVFNKIEGYMKSHPSEALEISEIAAKPLETAKEIATGFIETNQEYAEAQSNAMGKIFESSIVGQICKNSGVEEYVKNNIPSISSTQENDMAANSTPKEERMTFKKAMNTIAEIGSRHHNERTQGMAMAK